MLLVISFFVTLVAGDCIVVTGATGFVASHVIQLLFQKGYVVHGTVRDPSNKKKIHFLRELEEKYGANLKLFKADLLEPNPFDLAVEGCSAFLHVASPVVQGDMENQKMVDSAVKGTLSALNAAYKAKVKTMIITSSVATIGRSKAKEWTRLEDCSNPYNETDWNDVSTFDEDTYSFSKVQAELAMNAWISKFKKPPFRLATVHFPVALGPQLSTRVTSSNKVIYTSISGEYPFVIPLYLHLVDIRDVARAHVYLLEDKRAHGRYIVSIDQHASSKSFIDITNDILESEDLKSLPLSTFVISPWVLRLLSWLKLDEYLTAKVVKSAYFGAECGYDGSKITRELGFEYKYTDMKATIQEASRSMLQLGIVDRKSQMGSNMNVFLVKLVVFTVLLVLIICYCCCFKGMKDKND